MTTSQCSPFLKLCFIISFTLTLLYLMFVCSYLSFVLWVINHVQMSAKMLQLHLSALKKKQPWLQIFVTFSLSLITLHLMFYAYLSPSCQTIKDRETKEDFLHRLIKCFLSACFIPICTCKFYVWYTIKSIHFLQSELTNTYLWKLTHLMIFQELSHSLSKLSAFISKMRIVIPECIIKWLCANGLI